MRTHWSGAALSLLLLAGCQTPAASGPLGMSASDSGASNSGASGQSSGQSGHSSEQSGNSSEQSGQSGQSNSGDSSKSGGNNSASAFVPSASTATGTSAALGYVLWKATLPAAIPPAAAPAEVGKAAQVYLRARAHQLREDLALGAGPTLEDLAAAARIRRENLDTFGRLLRGHRAELLALADARTLTPERALEWLQRVGELARADPRLEEDHQAFLAWAAAGGTL